MIPQKSPLVVVLGGINMDLVSVTPRFPEAGETVVGSRFLTYAGGKGANQAAAAARMGARAAMVGRVGDDPFGAQLLQALSAAGVDCSNVHVTADCTSGIAVIAIDASGQNCIIQVPGANHACGEEELERACRLLPQASALLLQLEVPVDLSLQAARAAVKLDIPVILDPAPPRSMPAELYELCTIITPNETEAQALVGFPVHDDASARRAASEILARGARAVALKLGERGAYYATTKEARRVPPFPVKMVDSVAAGDAFNGALAVALAEGREMAEALPLAAGAGAFAVTRHGALDAMPSREEVERLVAAH